MAQYGQGVPQGTQYQEQAAGPTNPPPQSNNNPNYQPHPQSDYPPTEPGSDGAGSPPPQQGYNIPRRKPSYGQASGPQRGYQAQNMYYAPPQARYRNDWQNQIFDCLTPGELCM
jgi:hypothetical protein